jgi:hypothetical protein
VADQEDRSESFLMLASKQFPQKNHGWHVCPKVKENTIKPNRLLLQKKEDFKPLEILHQFIDIP